MSADRHLRMAELIQRKGSAARAVLGADDSHRAIEDADARIATPEAHEILREIISGWTREPHPVCDDAVIVAGAVSATRAGFLAAVEITGELFLLSSGSAGVSDRPADAARTCTLACGNSASVDHIAVRVALREINAWIDDRKSDDLSGIGPSSFLTARRRILERIDSLGADTPIHRRAGRARLLHSARSAASAPHGLAQEKKLMLLASDAIEAGSDVWLSKVADLGAGRQKSASAGNFRVRALLLLVAPTPPLSS